MTKEKLILTVAYKQHENNNIPVTILSYPTEPNGEYIVYSPLSDRTFSVYEGHVKKYCEPEYSEYVVDPVINNIETINTQPYYKGKSSLYKFAEEWGLNSYEFDQIKRIVRCRHKGNFIEDLNKTKDLIDIYIKEQGDKYEKKVN